MDNPNYEAEFKALIEQDTKLGWFRWISQNLARVHLGGLHGFDALDLNLQPLAQSVITYAQSIGAVVQISSTLRTFAEQDYLYTQGRSRAGAIITNAQGGQSYHNYGLAFDLVPTKLPSDMTQTELWAHLGAFAETIGLEWGGHFNDYDHFEYHPQFTWHDIIGYFKPQHE